MSNIKRIARKTPVMKRIETNQGEDIEEVLRRLYVDENLSAHNISKQLNVSYRLIVDWLKRAGVYSRKLDIGDGE